MISSQDIDAQLAELEAAMGSEDHMEVVEDLQATQDQEDEEAPTTEEPTQEAEDPSTQVLEDDAAETEAEDPTEEQDEDDSPTDQADGDATEAPAQDPAETEEETLTDETPADADEEEAAHEAEPEPVEEHKAAAPAAAKRKALVKPAAPAAAPAGAAPKKPNFSVKKVAKPAALPKKKVLARPAPQEDPATDEATENQAPAADDNDQAGPSTKPAPAVPVNSKGLVVKKGAAAAAAVAKPAAGGVKPAPKPKVVPAAAGAGGSKKEMAGDEVQRPKRGLNAYMIFSNAKRAEVKAENPKMAPKEILSALGAMWKELSPEERAPYEEEAKADKERYDQELAACGPLPPKEKKIKAKTGYQLFCDGTSAQMKKDNPKAGQKEINALLTAAWAELGEEGQKEYNEQSKELKKQTAPAGKTTKPKPKVTTKKHAATDDADEDMQEADAATDDGGERGPSAGAAKKRKAPARGRATGRKRVKNTAGQEGGASQDGDEDLPDADDEQEDKDREEISWELHPVRAIISKNVADGVYVVVREGLPLHKYGEYPISEANMHRSGQGEGDCPISGEMIQEYDDFMKKFGLDLHSSQGRDRQTSRAVLDLSNLPEGSLLEICKLLGDLREEGYELEKSRKNKLLPKDDAFMSVPMLGTCRLVQRLVGVERMAAAAAQAQTDEFKAKWLAAEAKLKSVGRASGEGLAAMGVAIEG